MNFSKRFQVAKSVVYGVLFLLILGLFQTQVIHGINYRRSSERNRIRLIPLPAPRGNIVDRNGVVYATNRPAYHVYVTPEDFDPQDFPRLAKLLEMKEEDLRAQISRSRARSLTPILIRSDISKELAMKIEERKPGLGGVLIQMDAVRYYPERELNGQILGYIGKISKEEYETFDRHTFGLYSLIGRSGIEKSFDSLLRGEDGGKQIEVNARGQQIRVLSERESISGNDVALSLDIRFQKEITPLLGNHNASVVMGDLETGEILALLSKPNFDPNVFVEGEKDEERIRLLKDKRRPLVNRAVMGVYPPGSVFKLVTALAGLETGKITRYTTFHCPGYFQLNPHSRRFKCWDADGHGPVDLLKGLERSCNVYFYNVGRLVGEKGLAQYARMLGLGEPLALEIPSVDGFIPSADWKKARYHDSWYGGETLSFAIGQGFVQVTPLHILRLVSIIAKDGEVPSFTLIKANGQHPPARKVKIHPDSFRAIKQGMLQVVESKYGTGQLARLDFMRVAGKTGTAQAPPNESHAWFSGFFPYEHPKIALVVLVEHGGSGGLTAARLAKQVLYVWKKHYADGMVFAKPELPPVNL